MPAKINAAKASPSHFLIAVSTRENLELCIKHRLAGFPSSESGAWTYCEVEEGDFISFLYGARAHGLYKVAKKEAIRNAENIGPWQPLKFQDKEKTYSFPFRLSLQPIRLFVETIVRTEFFYVAENLLLRGGYRKTHFQADQTTLQAVSQMGTIENGLVATSLAPPSSTFTPRFTQTSHLIKRPEIFRFRETVLQTAIRHHLLYQSNLDRLLSSFCIANAQADTLEVLGEKASTRGHIDLLVKQRAPMGFSLNIPMEVKTKRAQPADVLQLRGYMDELREECPLGILIAADFGKQTFQSALKNNVKLVRYDLHADLKRTPTFQEIYDGLTLELASK